MNTLRISVELDGGNVEFCFEREVREADGPLTTLERTVDEFDSLARDVRNTLNDLLERRRETLLAQVRVEVTG